METVKHTPVPWRIDGKDIITDAGLVPEREDIIAHVDPLGPNRVPTMDVVRANAAFIVRACNAHDMLVAALEHALHVATAIRNSGVLETLPGADDEIEEVFAEASAALAAAESK